METVKRSIFINFQFENTALFKSKKISQFWTYRNLLYTKFTEKFHKDFYEVFQFELACIGLRNISVSSCPLFMHI